MCQVTPTHQVQLSVTAATQQLCLPGIQAAKGWSKNPSSAHIALLRAPAVPTLLSWEPWHCPCCPLKALALPTLLFWVSQQRPHWSSKSPSIAHAALLRASPVPTLLFWEPTLPSWVLMLPFWEPPAVPMLPSRSCHGALALLTQGSCSRGPQESHCSLHIYSWSPCWDQPCTDRSHVAPTFRHRGGSPT